PRSVARGRIARDAARIRHLGQVRHSRIRRLAKLDAHPGAHDAMTTALTIHIRATRAADYVPVPAPREHETEHQKPPAHDTSAGPDANGSSKAPKAPSARSLAVIRGGDPDGSA